MKTRDHRKLKVFEKADALVLLLCPVLKFFPADERFGLTSQLRRAVLSIAANIVEGSARHTTKEYCRFLEIAHSSAREAQYELSVAARLGYFEGWPERLAPEGKEVLREAESLVEEVCRMLSKLHENLDER